MLRDREVGEPAPALMSEMPPAMGTANTSPMPTLLMTGEKAIWKEEGLLVL